MCYVSDTFIPIQYENISIPYKPTQWPAYKQVTLWVFFHWINNCSTEGSRSAWISADNTILFTVCLGTQQGVLPYTSHAYGQ